LAVREEAVATWIFDFAVVVEAHMVIMVLVDDQRCALSQ
jgi:hypothetical protein